MEPSVCGIFDCSSCSNLNEGECSGCVKMNRDLQEIGEATCRIYDCATKGGISTCNDCSKSACRFYRRADTVCPLRGKYENSRWWGSKLAKGLLNRHRSDKDSEDKISQRTIERLRWYLIALDSLVAQGISSVSSWQLSQQVGVGAPLIRKDLSRFGGFGTPSFGYDVKYLRRKIMNILHLDLPKHVVWLGAKKLREHHQIFSRLKDHNCKVVAVLDSDTSQIDRTIGKLQVMSLDSLTEALNELEVDAAVIALPAPADAQNAASILANQGVKAMLNLTPSLLVVPEDVTLRNLDVVGELLTLAYYCGERRSEKDKD